MMLSEYKRIKLKIQHPIEQLMAPWLANVDDAIQPGLMLLTWTSLNIEKYINTVLYKLGKSLASFHQLLLVCFCVNASCIIKVTILYMVCT